MVPLIEYGGTGKHTKHKEDADNEVKINSIQAGRYRSLFSEIIQILIMIL